LFLLALSVKPTIYLPFKEIVAEIGEQIELKCQVNGSPQPRIV